MKRSLGKIFRKIKNTTYMSVEKTKYKIKTIYSPVETEDTEICFIETNLDDKLREILARKLGEELIFLSDTFRLSKKT